VDIVIKPQYANAIKWSKGSCGNSGCTEDSCACSFCGGPIGIPQDDPRRDNPDEYCVGCEICEDDVPLMLFDSKRNLQAQFHRRCSELLFHFRSNAAGRA
jgi:hypothetical protein